MFSLVTCAKLLLTGVSPLQDLLDTPGITHGFCNQQAVKILKNDGFATYADWLQQYLPELNAGVYWADKGWKNVSHYLDPDTRRGMWEFSHAVNEFMRYFSRAVKLAKNGQPDQAVFFLGAAGHLVQDLCVPHHARAKLFHGHREYEAWAQKHCTEFAVQNQGIYACQQNPCKWVLNNAVIAAELYSYVSQESSEPLYRRATEVLLPQAQRTTAGLFHQFITLATDSVHKVPKTPAIIVA